MHTPVRVLFVCDGGSARSRMAEVLLRSLVGDRLEVHSAGIAAEDLDPRAIEVMREIGIEFDNTPTPALNDFEDRQFDYVIALCEEAKAACLAFPRDAHNLHWTVLDPTQAKETKAEQLTMYREARDQIREQLEAWVGSLR